MRLLFSRTRLRRLCSGSDNRRNAVGKKDTFTEGGPFNSRGRQMLISIRVRSSAPHGRKDGSGNLPAVLGGACSTHLPSLSLPDVRIPIEGEQPSIFAYPWLFLIWKDLFESLVVLLNILCQPGKVLGFERGENPSMANEIPPGVCSSRKMAKSKSRNVQPSWTSSCTRTLKASK